MTIEEVTSEETIQAITRRLVQHFRPERVYLFGSVARGDYGPNSDLDFLVVVRDDAPKELLRGASSALRGMHVAADVVPWRQSDFDGRAKYVRASLPATVIREGRLLYDARQAPA